MTTMVKVLLITSLIINISSLHVIEENPRISFSPCPGTDIKSVYQYGVLPLAEENQYDVIIPMVDREPKVEIVITLDTNGAVSLVDKPSQFSTTSTDSKNNTFILTFFNLEDYNIKLRVKGMVRRVIPYIKSIKINNIERCARPITGYLNKIAQDILITKRMLSERLSVYNCGRRNLDYNELIVGGQSAKPGDWPWHAAIYKAKDGGSNFTYICGGTLISKLFVLTAAHCTTTHPTKAAVPPESLKVYLGKYRLFNRDDLSEEREVFSVTVHEDFPFSRQLNNDIALLKLKSEVVYSDYVHPACIWSNSASIKTAWSLSIGTVVGWGRYEMRSTYLATELKQTNLPLVSNEQCLLKDPTFYGNILSNGKKFCAGWGNGTSPCNGDSGGGYMVYVPDADNSTSTGAWYVRGVVSVGKLYPGTTSCDPSYYSVFTDLKFYESWILNKTICSCFPPVAQRICLGGYGNMKTVDSC